MFIKLELTVTYITPPLPEYDEDLEKKQFEILIFLST